VTRRQALGAGMSDGAVTARLRFGRWQRIHQGVYATFTGPIERDARLWAAVLAAGPGALLSHETAAEINRITDRPSPFIHVSIPATRRATAPDGVKIHLSGNLARGWRFARGIPPHTFAEETVIDLVHAAANLEDVIAYVTGGFGKKRLSQGRLTEVAAARKKLRWRGDLDEIIAAAAGGAHSVIEYRYDRDVEQAHGLPSAAKQVKYKKPDGSRGYRDRYYAQYRLIVELDGKQYHGPEHRGRDQDRDNDAAATAGAATLRYGWEDVTRRKCESARQVHAALAKRGYKVPLKPCSSACAAITLAEAGRPVRRLRRPGARLGDCPGERRPEAAPASRPERLLGRPPERLAQASAGEAAQQKPRLREQRLRQQRYVSSADRTASVSVRSGSTACAPAAASSLAVKPPVATPTARAPLARAASMSSGVSPITTVASPSNSAGDLPCTAAARRRATGTSSARTS